jgi:DNA-binding XRE family transcriptional regulator
MPGKDKKRPRTAPTAGGRTQEAKTPMPTRKRSRVAEARDRAGLSQPALADRVGVGRATIARIEAGRVSPSVAVALAISRELGQPVEALFGGER